MSRNFKNCRNKLGLNWGILTTLTPQRVPSFDLVRAQTKTYICRVINKRIKEAWKSLLFISLLVSSLRTATCPFNIFLCNGNCSSTIISLHSLILCWLRACASHWLLCAVWSNLDVRSPHSHRETTSETVAMGRIRTSHFGILTFSLLLTFVRTQG